MLIRFVVTGVGSFILPYIQNWEISLVLTAIVPVMAVMGGVMGMIMSKAGMSILLNTPHDIPNLNSFCVYPGVIMGYVG